MDERSGSGTEGQRLARRAVIGAVAGGLVALAALALLGAGAIALAAGSTVAINDVGYTPATVTITAGDAVTWRNTSGRTHTVTADDGSFDSGPLSLSDQFANVFDKPGTFSYHCSIHPNLTGTVIVKAAAATPEPSGPPLPTPPPGTLPPSFQPKPTPSEATTATPATIPSAATPTPGTSPSPGPDAGSSTARSIVPIVLVLALAVLVMAAVVAIRRRPRPS